MRDNVLIVGMLLFYSVLSLSQGCFSEEANSHDNISASADFPEADAVVLKSEGNMRISDYEAEFSVHKKIKILTKKGERFAAVTVSFNPHIQVIGIKGTTVKQDGTIVRLEEKNIFESSLFTDYVLFSEDKYKLFVLPEVGTGCIVEYSYTLKINSLAFWPGWSFQDEVPVLHSSYKLTVPPDLEFRYYLRNDKQNKVEFSQRANEENQYLWVAKNLPAVSGEEYLPPFDDLAITLSFVPVHFRISGPSSTIQTWNDVANWYYGLIANRCQASEEAKIVTQNLCKGKDSEKDKTAAVFNWVQENIRYVAVDVGISGYQPHFASETFNYRYGDCKDMSNLLVAMLRHAGIEAHAALVRTRNTGELIEDFPSPRQFNHVMVCAVLDSEYVWLDATDDLCNFGEIPEADQGLKVLVVKTNRGELLQTPITPAEKNSLHRMWRINLREDGSLTGDLQIEATGHIAKAFRGTLKDRVPEKTKAWLTDYLKIIFREAATTQFSISNLSDNILPLQIECHFIGTPGLTQIGKLLLIPNKLLGGVKSIPALTKDERKYPVRLKFNSLSIDHVILNLPPLYQVDYLPEDLEFPHSSAHFSCVYRTEGAKIEVEKKLSFEKTDIPLSEYKALKDFYRKIAEEDSKHIVLKKMQRR